VIANKLDKIKKSEREGNVHLIRETRGLPEDVQVILFSVEKGDGRDEMLQIIEEHIAPEQETIEE
jgi:GTP-binding protein